MSAGPIRILVADDHPFFRDGLRVLLETTPDTELAGEAKTGDEVVTLVAELSPDVVLMDLRMPGMGASRLRARYCAAIPTRPSWS